VRRTDGLGRRVRAEQRSGMAPREAGVPPLSLFVPEKPRCRVRRGEVPGPRPRCSRTTPTARVRSADPWGRARVRGATDLIWRW